MLTSKLEILAFIYSKKSLIKIKIEIFQLQIW